MGISAGVPMSAWAGDWVGAVGVTYLHGGVIDRVHHQHRRSHPATLLLARPLPPINQHVGAGGNRGVDEGHNAIAAGVVNHRAHLGEGVRGGGLSGYSCGWVVVVVGLGLEM